MLYSVVHLMDTFLEFRINHGFCGRSVIMGVILHLALLASTITHYDWEVLNHVIEEGGGERERKVTDERGQCTHP